MPYTRITPSRNGREALAYALGRDGENKGHNGHEVRNLFVTTVGLSPNEPPSFADQMDVYWMQASSRNKTQVRRIITSYSKEELDPADPRSAYIAGEIAREHAKRFYPDRQVVICVQADGVGGCIHTHEIVSNVSMTDLKGCTDEQTKFHYVAKSMDGVAKEFIDLTMDYADKWDEKTGKAILPKDKVNQNVRRMRDENREAEANGEQAPNYIWQDDLKERIKLAMSEATSREDFEKRLTAHGVEMGRAGYSKKHGDYFTYELVDTTGFEEPPKKEPKARSYSLGADFTPEALDQMIASRKKTVTVTVKPEIKVPRYTPPKPKQMTPEEQEAKHKRELEAQQFSDWCHDRGIVYYSLDKGMDLDVYEDAQKQYKEWLIEQKQKATSHKAQEGTSNDVDDKIIVEDDKTPVEGKYSVPRVRKHNGKVESPQKAPEQPTPPKPTTVKENKNQAMIQRVLRDAQLMQDQLEDGEYNPYDGLQ